MNAAKTHLEDEEVQEEEDECPDEGTQLQAHDPAQAPLPAQQGALSLQAVALLSQVDPQEPARVVRGPLTGGGAKQGCPVCDGTARRRLQRTMLLPLAMQRLGRVVVLPP